MTKTTVGNLENHLNSTNQNNHEQKETLLQLTLDRIDNTLQLHSIQISSLQTQRSLEWLLIVLVIALWACALTISYMMHVLNQLNQYSHLDNSPIHHSYTLGKDSIAEKAEIIATNTIATERLFALRISVRYCSDRSLAFFAWVTDSTEILFASCAFTALAAKIF